MAELTKEKIEGISNGTKYLIALVAMNIKGSDHSIMIWPVCKRIISRFKLNHVWIREMEPLAESSGSILCALKNIPIFTRIVRRINRKS